MFREVIASGSQDYLKFENVVSGNELECWQDEVFTAPVDGIYVFNLHIATYNQNRAYRLRAWINGGIGGFEQLQENSVRYYGYCCVGHNHSFQIEKELKVGDTLMITDEWAYNTVYDYNEYKCNTNGEDHSCSYITGRLIKRLQ